MTFETNCHDQTVSWMHHEHLKDSKNGDHVDEINWLLFLSAHRKKKKTPCFFYPFSEKENKRTLQSSGRKCFNIHPASCLRGLTMEFASDYAIRRGNDLHPTSQMTESARIAPGLTWRSPDSRPKAATCPRPFASQSLSIAFPILHEKMGGFHQWGYPNSWMVNKREKPFNG